MIMQKVSNMELFYKAVTFYLEEQPLLLNSLLTTVAAKVDHARVCHQVRKAGHLPLIQTYLKQVQQHNIAPVNEAINDLYIETEQFEDLRSSIEEFDNFDQIALAQRLEKHELLEMRRIAALVYKKNKRFKQSIDLSKQDKMYKDAMETSRDSGSAELAEATLNFFLENNDQESFAACLYTCYEFLRPDVVLAIAWRHRYMDYAMPYLIQTVREYTERVEALDKKSQRKDEEEEKQKSAANDYVPDYIMPTMQMPGMGQPMLMPPQQGYGGQQMGGQQMGGMPGMGMPGQPMAMYPGQQF